MYAVFLCDDTTGCEAYFLTTDVYEIFNMRANEQNGCVPYPFYLFLAYK